MHFQCTSGWFFAVLSGCKDRERTANAASQSPPPRFHLPTKSADAVDSSANGLAGKMANCLFKKSLLYVEAIGRNVEHGRFATRSHSLSAALIESRH